MTKRQNKHGTLLPSLIDLLKTQLMQGFMVAVGHKFCIVSINFNVVSLLFHMHSKL
jgi:hypothetical protein